MERKFIIALSEHRVAGFVFYPYIAELQNRSESYTLVERITSDDVRKRPTEFTDDEKKIVKIIDEYSDSELVRVFSKKRVTNQEFLASLSADMLQNHVRPYIERRLIHIVELLQNSHVPAFYKDSAKQVYCSDQISFEKTPAEAIFNFILNETEFKYYLSVNHNGREMKLTSRNGYIIVNDPCHLLVDKKLLIFNDIDGKKLGPFFKNEYVSVPKARERDYLEKFVLNAIKKYRVNCSGFSIVDDSPKPTIKLALEGDLQYNPVLNLTFDYGLKRSFHYKQSAETVVTLDETPSGYVFYKTSRNTAIEAQTGELLVKLGLKSDNTAFFRLAQSPDDLPEDLIGNMVNWLNEHQAELSSAKINVVQEFFDKKYFTQAIKLETSLSQKEDWFDVYTVVKLGTFEIPFVRFRKHILSNKREFVLPDGQIVILPQEWFAQYVNMFFLGQENGDHMMFKPLQLQSLSQLPGYSNKEYQNSLLALYEKDSTQDVALPDMHALLRPYQVDGFAWMTRLQQNNLGGCLADDMGLGKTLQTLTLLKRAIGQARKKASESQTLVSASLVILPASLVHNWYNEIQKFAPELKTLKYVGTNRNIEIDTLSDYDIVLTTYGVIRNEYEALSKYPFFYIILDESQNIKNPESKIFQAVTELKSTHRLVLTGTPIENSLTDLWSQIEFVNPGLLGDLSFFKQYFAAPIEKDGDEKKRDRLKQLIQPFILRRTKQEVAPDLPPLTQQLLFCSMSDAQKQFYEEEKSKVRNQILSSIEEVGVEKSAMMMLNALMRLRQIANHPVMVEPNYLEDSGKFEEITGSLENMYVENHKVLIFSSFVRHLELFEKFFEAQNWQYAKLTGETRNREFEVDKFQKNEDVKFFLISLKAGGVGLNLTAADYVFILDPWWNPAAEMQAINRAHRIGQTNNVFVYRFITAETIEEKIVKLQEYKAELAELFINSNNPFKELSREAILDLFD